MTYTGSALEEKDYGYPEGLHVEWMPHNGFGAIMTRKRGRVAFQPAVYPAHEQPALFPPYGGAGARFFTLGSRAGALMP